MGLLHSSLQTVAGAIQQTLGADVEVKDHPGRFTERELGQIVKKRKAVRVAIEAIDTIQVQGNGQKRTQVQFNAFVMCADQPGQDRHEAALAIVETLAATLPFANWGDAETFRAVAPATIDIQNLYSGEVEGKGIAWWAVSWTQGISGTQGE